MGIARDIFWTGFKQNLVCQTDFVGGKEEDFLRWFSQLAPSGVKKNRFFDELNYNLEKSLFLPRFAYIQNFLEPICGLNLHFLFSSEFRDRKMTKSAVTLPVAGGYECTCTTPYAIIKILLLTTHICNVIYTHSRIHTSNCIFITMNADVAVRWLQLRRG